MYVSLLFSVTPHFLPPPSLELISLSIHSDKAEFCICIFIAHPIRPDVFLILCVPLVSICANNFHNFILLGD